MDEKSLILILNPRQQAILKHFIAVAEVADPNSSLVNFPPDTPNYDPSVGHDTTKLSDTDLPNLKNQLNCSWGKIEDTEDNSYLDILSACVEVTGPDDYHDKKTMLESIARLQEKYSEKYMTQLMDEVEEAQDEAIQRTEEQYDHIIKSIEQAQKKIDDLSEEIQRVAEDLLEDTRPVKNRQ